MARKISILIVFLLSGFMLFSCKSKPKPAPSPDNGQNEAIPPKPTPNPTPSCEPGKPKTLDRGMLNIVAKSMFVKNLDKFLGKPIDEVDPDDFVYSFKETYGWKDSDFTLIKPKFEDLNEEIIITYKLAHKSLLSSVHILKLTGFKKATQPAIEPEDQEESLTKAFQDADLILSKESKSTYLFDLTEPDFKLLNVDEKHHSKLVLELNKNFLTNSVSVTYYLKQEQELSFKKVKTFTDFKNLDTETIKAEFLKVNPITAVYGSDIFKYSKALKTHHSNSGFTYTISYFLAHEQTESVEVYLDGYFKNLRFETTIVLTLNANKDKYELKSAVIAELSPRLDEKGLKKFEVITKINLNQIKANEIFSKLNLTLNENTEIDLLTSSEYLLKITAMPAKKGVLQLKIEVVKEFKTLTYSSGKLSESAEQKPVFSQIYQYNFKE